MNDLPKRYSKPAIILHWLIALMVIVGLVVGGAVLAEVDNTDPEKLFMLRGHMIMGMLIGALMIWRIIVRLKSIRPVAAHTGNALLDRLAGLAHFLLYILVIAMVTSGLGISILAGLPEIVFQGIGDLPTNFNDLPPRAAHGVIAKVLAAMIVLHIAGALYHQFKLKDNLLSRMGIGSTK